MLRKTLALVLPATVLVALLAGGVRASQPIWAARATITQVGDRLVFTGGDFFTQEGSPVTRRVYRLLRDGTAVLGEVPPSVSRPGISFRGENVTSYRLRPTDYGKSFELEVYAGVASHYPSGLFVEWGGRNALTGEQPNRSEPIVARAPAGVDTTNLTRDAMVEAANAQIRIWRRQGLSERQIARTRIARARAVLLRR
jgi:hypothetical protein